MWAVGEAMGGGGCTGRRAMCGAPTSRKRVIVIRICMHGSWPVCVITDMWGEGVREGSGWVATRRVGGMWGVGEGPMDGWRAGP